jgi:hypothetical protein
MKIEILNKNVFIDISYSLIREIKPMKVIKIWKLECSDKLEFPNRFKNFSSLRTIRRKCVE